MDDMHRKIHLRCEDKNIYDLHFSPHAQVLFNSAWRLCGNKDDAEDLLQETFFFALKHFSQLNDHRKCKFWLFTILKNLFFKEVQKNKRQVDLEVDQILNAFNDVNGLEHDYIKEEVDDLIRNLLDAMEEKLRRPLILFYYERMSYKEIAEQMNLPIGTVMSRIARGKVYLKKQLLRSGEFCFEWTPIRDDAELILKI